MIQDTTVAAECLPLLLLRTAIVEPVSTYLGLRSKHAKTAHNSTAALESDSNGMACRSACLLDTYSCVSS
jgi:hypothetical protein